MPSCLVVFLNLRTPRWHSTFFAPVPVLRNSFTLHAPLPLSLFALLWSCVIRMCGLVSRPLQLFMTPGARPSCRCSVGVWVCVLLHPTLLLLSLTRTSGPCLTLSL